MINQLFWIVPVCSVIALAFAYMFFRGMMKESEGNETMKRIAGHVRKGAMAYACFLPGWRMVRDCRTGGCGLPS